MATESQMWAALLELLQASDSLDEMEQVLRRNRAIMLKPDFSQYFRRLRAHMGDTKDRNVYRENQVERILQNAIEHDITYAISVERGDQDKIRPLSQDVVAHFGDVLATLTPSENSAFKATMQSVLMRDARWAALSRAEQLVRIKQLLEDIIAKCRR